MILKAKTKLILVTVSIVTIAISAVTIACLSRFNAELKRQAMVSQESRIKTFWALLHQKGKDFTIVDGRLMVGSYVLNGNYALPDQLKELCGGTATVFMGDTRVSTNVMKPDGSRAVGTQLKGVAYDSVIKNAKPYRGEADILGVPYFTAYDPIKDTNGKVIGVVYVGVKKSEFFAAYDVLKRVIILIALIIMAVAGLVSWRVMSRAFQPLGALHDVILNIAQGNLNKRMDFKRNDEIGQIALALNSMVDKIKGVLADVKIVADEVASGSQELSSESEVISRGASEQAAAADEASSSMNEITFTIRENSDKSQQAEAIAVRLAEDAVQGGVAVDETVRAMKLIANKISVIEEIARQTNLLALNAAIEAARAGTHGKGFTVVASEVRKLAERSQIAACEISDISQVSVEVAEAAGEKLTGIISDVNKTASFVQEISSAGRKQDEGTAEVNKAIQKLDKVTQQNASATDEMASTAEELATQAGKLIDAISFFNFEDTSVAGSNGKRGDIYHLKTDEALQKKASTEIELCGTHFRQSSNY